MFKKHYSEEKNDKWYSKIVVKCLWDIGSSFIFLSFLIFKIGNDRDFSLDWELIEIIVIAHW